MKGRLFLQMMSQKAVDINREIFFSIFGSNFIGNFVFFFPKQSPQLFFLLSQQMPKTAKLTHRCLV